MIVNFLYKMDEKNKRAITGMVVDDSHMEYDPLKNFNLVLEDDLNLKEGQTVVYNYGTQYYGIINTEEKPFYLNMNDFKLTIKISLTDKLGFATTASKEFLETFVAQFNNFNMSDPLSMVEAGYDLTKSGGYKDYFGFFFRKVTDNVYCEFTSGKKPMFIGRDNGVYVLTDDFKNAYRVMKNDVRPLLVTRGYVSKEVDKKTVSFSRFNVFSDGESYGFGGENSFLVSNIDGVIRITMDFIPDNTFKLVNDEQRSIGLKNMCYEMKKEKKDVMKLFEIDGMYAKSHGDLSFELVDNAAYASTYDTRDIELLIQAYSLFNENVVYHTLDACSCFCYFKEDNGYILSQEVLEYRSTPISLEDYHAFDACFKEKATDEGVLLLSVDKYVKLSNIHGFEFDLEFVDTGFDATIFTKSQADLITRILKANFKRKELSPIRSTYQDYPIKNTKVLPLQKKYDELIQHIHTSSIRLNPYPKLDEIKTSSDKNALEYLKSLYPKCVMDACSLFHLILRNNTDVKKILIVGATATCDLQGLAYACDKLERDVEVWTSETVKWGYLPVCELGNHVHVQNRYRLPFSSFPKGFIEQFDLIYFGKSFNEETNLVSPMLKNLCACEKSMFLVHTQLCEIGRFQDTFYQAVKKELEVSRKYNHLKLEDYNLKDANMEEISFSSPMLSNKISYQNVLKIQNGKIIDLFKKN